MANTQDREYLLIEPTAIFTYHESIVPEQGSKRLSICPTAAMYYDQRE
jgi:hypothetical protein